MKTFDLNALPLLLITTFFLMAIHAKADTTNIKMAWDFRTNEWQTIEFIREKIEIYKTSEDVTDKVLVERIKERIIFYIKERK